MGAPDLTAFRLPSTSALDGATYVLTLADGGSVKLRFDGGAASWTADDVPWQRHGHGTGACDVVEIAPEVYFADIEVTDPAHDALTVVMAMGTGWALVVHQRRDPGAFGRGPAATHTFAVARIGGLEATGPPPAPTSDLVGRWHRYRYSEHNLYEHIYVSQSRFVSHNVATEGTPDRADCHPVSYYKVAPELYVVAWREFDSQASMVMAENLDQLRVTGKALHPASPEESVNLPIGGLVYPVDVAIPEGAR